MIFYTVGMKHLSLFLLCVLLVCSCGDKERHADKPFWISRSGKTHNASCEFYGYGHGRYSTHASRRNCKICGGDCRGHAKSYPPEPLEDDLPELDGYGTDHEARKQAERESELRAQRDYHEQEQRKRFYRESAERARFESRFPYVEPVRDNSMPEQLPAPGVMVPLTLPNR